MERANWLKRFFGEDEIKKKIFECSIDKAHGPDGYNFAFFHMCREMIREELLEVFFEFYNDGIVNKITNVTFLRLIMKKPML